MERLIVVHQRRRNCLKAPLGYEADHIIPYCICMDDSKENIQFITKKEHREKTKIDFKILKEFRKEGFTEKVTNYSIELKKPIDFLIKEYKLRFRTYKTQRHRMLYNFL